jgi:molybdopterin-containing oxidoreductase family membrane subunit
MLELAIKGGKKYYGWMTFLTVIVGVGFLLYLKQLDFGLGITGLSRDASWGFYIANFTFLVGVAAGGVMVVLPYYLHDYKAFGNRRFGPAHAGSECLIVSHVQFGAFLGLHCLKRLPVFKYRHRLECAGGRAQRGALSKVALKPLIYISIPWAISIHTVTAYLYCGLPGRGFWMTAILAPRFLSSAFAAGPALLILCCLIIRRVSSFDPGREQIQSLAKIVAYAICVNVFFFLCEVFVTFYSQIPEHMDHIKYLFVGLHGHGAYVPWMWASFILMIVGIILTVVPTSRKNEGVLAVACVVIFLGTWIDKGLGMIAGGFTPSPLHEVNEYIPSLPEIGIALGIWAMGFLVMTALFKIAVSVKEEVRG